MFVKKCLYQIASSVPHFAMEMRFAGTSEPSSNCYSVLVSYSVELVLIMARVLPVSEVLNEQTCYS